MQKVIITSKNPVKINSITTAFLSIFPQEEFAFENVAVQSGVANQPLTSNETLLGAMTRVHNASEEVAGASYYVGIEGGVEENESGMECFAWVVIQAVDRKIGRAKTASFYLPQKVVDLIKQGKELGEADDIVFNMKNTKQKMGVVGILTKGKINRTEYYISAIQLALIPFMNSDLY